MAATREAQATGQAGAGEALLPLRGPTNAGGSFPGGALLRRCSLADTAAREVWIRRGGTGPDELERIQHRRRPWMDSEGLWMDLVGPFYSFAFLIICFD